MDYNRKELQRRIMNIKILQKFSEEEASLMNFEFEENCKLVALKKRRGNELVNLEISFYL